MLIRFIVVSILQHIHTWNQCFIPETNKILYVNYTSKNRQMATVYEEITTPYSISSPITELSW